jgi:hypothetical protein
MYMYIQPEKQSGNLPNLSQGSLATHKSIALGGVEGLDFTLALLQNPYTILEFHHGSIHVFCQDWM